VDDAIRARKLAPARRDWAEAYARRDPQAFARYVDRAPEIFPETERGSARSLPTRTLRRSSAAGSTLLDIAIQLDRAAADLPDRSEREDPPANIMAAAWELLGFPDELRIDSRRAARDIKGVVRYIGARADVKAHTQDLRAASRAADRIVGKPGPHIGRSVLPCEELKTKYEKWQNDARVKDRRQSAFASDVLHVSVSTLQRKLRECGMDLMFVRSRKAPK